MLGNEDDMSMIVQNQYKIWRLGVIIFLIIAVPPVLLIGNELSKELYKAETIYEEPVYALDVEAETPPQESPAPILTE